jgi:hemerythrin superfamily protein
MASDFDDPDDDLGDDSDRASARGGGASIDALTQLREDHEQIDALFADYEADEGAMDDAVRLDRAEMLCALLTIHTAIEEEIFYPAVRSRVEGTDGLLDGAAAEHAAVKAQIEEILDMDADESGYDAKVIALGAAVRSHFREEENELFPIVEDSGLDLDDLGGEIAERRAELIEEEGLDELV